MIPKYQRLAEKPLWGFVCCLVISSTWAHAQQTAQLTLSVAPPADTSITGNEQIAIEAFVMFSQNGGLKGGQFGFFCNITSGTTTLAVIPNGVSTPDTSVNGTAAVCIPGLAPTNQGTCYAVRSPLPLSPPCPLVANQLYYMATIVYDVSDCATDSAEVHAEPLGVADGVPMGTDETRFRDDAPGLGNLIPIVSESFTTLVPDLGICYDGTGCHADQINQYCCENGLYGGPPGCFDTNAISCAQPSTGECCRDEICDDGLKCNGEETCNLGLGQCIPGTPPNCDDGNSCTVDSCSQAAPGNGCVHNVAAANGMACGSTSDTDCDNPDTCLNGTCLSNNVANGTPCGSASDTECDNPDTCNGNGACNANNVGGLCTDDGIACTSDVCAGGACTHPALADGSPCDDGLSCTTGETCYAGYCLGYPVNCDDGLACSLEICNEATDQCESFDINSIPCSTDADCPSGVACGGSFCSCVENPDDNCPNVANPDQTDSDGDSVGDACDQCPGADDQLDEDNNGTPDCLQGIPTVSTWGLISLSLLLIVGAKIARFQQGKNHTRFAA